VALRCSASCALLYSSPQNSFPKIPSFLGPKGTTQISEERDVMDDLNPEKFGDLSVFTLPNAPRQLYVTPSDSVPNGKVNPTSFKSAKLKEDRTISLYTPPGYDGTTSVDLLIVFDGGNMMAARPA
jgi:hypothetical protein